MFTRSQPGCKLIEVTKNQELVDGNAVYYVYEKWDVKQQWEEYLKIRGEDGSLAALSEFFAAPPQFVHADLCTF